MGRAIDQMRTLMVGLEQRLFPKSKNQDFAPYPSTALRHAR